MFYMKFEIEALNAFFFKQNFCKWCGWFKKFCKTDCSHFWICYSTQQLCPELELLNYNNNFFFHPFSTKIITNFFYESTILLFINKNVEFNFGTKPWAYWTIIFFVSVFQMTPSSEIIRTTHLPQFGGVNFGLKSHYKIVLNIVKFFYIVFDANKNIKKLTRLYYILL